jgi:hypothetical protein
MTRTFRTSRLAVALAGAALATVALAPGATAIPYEDLRSPDAVEVPRVAGDPPPPSSIAASAGDEYQELRSSSAVDAARAGDPPRVVPRGAPIAALARDKSQDLRSPDSRDVALAQERYLSSYGASVAPSTQDLRSPVTRDAATGHGPTSASRPVVDTAPASDGFDWTSAAIGAAAGSGLLLILIAAFARTGRPGRRSIPARGQTTASA